MAPNTPSPPQPPVITPPVSSPPAKSGARWVLYGCGAVVALVLLIFATVGITLWWIQRPIKPVVLSTREKAVVDQKLRQLDSGRTSSSSSVDSRPAAPVENRAVEAVELPAVIPPPDANGTPNRRYVPGSKALTLTEREINGLLNANTDLGKSVRLEFEKDAVNAYIAVPIPKDFPIGGGKMFRARGSFRLSIGNGGAPYAVLEDVTVLGLSLPKAWLGGLKGENLLADAMGQRPGTPILKGIKSLRVEPGALVLEVED